MVIVAISASWAEAQPREIHAVRAVKPPVLDGKLDDECWAKAEPVTGFLSIDSSTPAARQSVVYVLYDPSHLYIAVKCLEPDKSRILGPVRPHDNGYIFGQDMVEVYLAPVRGAADYYQFAVNAGGSTYDAFGHRGGMAVDAGWDGEWQAKAFIGQDHWSVEMAIPFATLGLSPGGSAAWGIIICRHKVNPRELSSLGVRGGFSDAQRFATLKGLNVDFSRFCFRVGPPALTLKRVGDEWRADVTAPILNQTGQERPVRIAWEGIGEVQGDKGEQSVRLKPGESHLLALESLPTEKLLPHKNDRLIPSTTPKRAKVRALDAQTGETLAVSKLRPVAKSLGLRVDVDALYSAAAFSEPPKDVSFTVRLDLDEAVLRPCVLRVSLAALDGAGVATKSFRSPSQATRVTFAGEDVAWGGYVARAVLSNAQGHEMLSAQAEFPVLPRGPERVRVLNNFVTELLSLRDAQGPKELPFMNPRTGWVFFSWQADGKAELHLNDDGPLPGEAMRFLRMGRHTLRLEGAGLRQLIVRAIPELQYFYFPCRSWLTPFGAYDDKFLAKDVLPNCNAIVGGIATEKGDFAKDWVERLRRRWLLVTWLHTMPKEQQTDVDAVYQHWATHAGFTHPLTSGVIVDEFAGNTDELYRTWIQALRRLAANPELAGRSFYPYMCARMNNFTVRRRPFAEVVVAAGCPIAWERYLGEQPSEELAREHLQDLLVEELGTWASEFPGALRQTVVVLGYFSVPPQNLNAFPTVNYQTFMDMQYRTLATDPALFGLCGLQEYLSSAADPETVRWAGRLYRHYGIEGKTEPLSPHPYLLTHLNNPDFELGADGWTLQPAEPDSIAVKSLPGLAKLQGRYQTRSLTIQTGDSFLWTKRSAARPNVVSQEIRGLQPGKLYSLKLITADYQNLARGLSVKGEEAVAIRVAGGEALPGQSFQHSFSSTSAAAGFAKDKPAWLNYHWRVFKATAPTGRLTISDWAEADKPGGPVGQELLFNFVELQPYGGVLE
ncbi:MAG: carbohydrate binding family 9 domain-containing protein [Planctomycetes bacterium]|nr:carbohydrate binding family 9 domain-containing protein [Planctomycetota bacterium]